MFTATQVAESLGLKIVEKPINESRTTKLNQLFAAGLKESGVNDKPKAIVVTADGVLIVGERTAMIVPPDESGDDFATLVDLGRVMRADETELATAFDELQSIAAPHKDQFTLPQLETLEGVAADGDLVTYHNLINSTLKGQKDAVTALDEYRKRQAGVLQQMARTRMKNTGPLNVARRKRRAWYKRNRGKILRNRKVYMKRVGHLMKEQVEVVECSDYATACGLQMLCTGEGVPCDMVELDNLSSSGEPAVELHIPAEFMEAYDAYATEDAPTNSRRTVEEAKTGIRSRRQYRNGKHPSHKSHYVQKLRMAEAVDEVAIADQIDCPSDLQDEAQSVADEKGVPQAVVDVTDPSDDNGDDLPDDQRYKIMGIDDAFAMDDGTIVFAAEPADFADFDDDDADTDDDDADESARLEFEANDRALRKIGLMDDHTLAFFIDELPDDQLDVLENGDEEEIDELFGRAMNGMRKAVRGFNRTFRPGSGDAKRLRSSTRHRARIKRNVKKARRRMWDKYNSANRIVKMPRAKTMEAADGMKPFKVKVHYSTKDEKNAFEKGQHKIIKVRAKSGAHAQKKANAHFDKKFGNGDTNITGSRITPADITSESLDLAEAWDADGVINTAHSGYGTSGRNKGGHVHIKIKKSKGGGFKARVTHSDGAGGGAKKHDLAGGSASDMASKLNGHLKKIGMMEASVTEAKKKKAKSKGKPYLCKDCGATFTASDEGDQGTDCPTCDSDNTTPDTGSGSGSGSAGNESVDEDGVVIARTLLKLTDSELSVALTAIGRKGADLIETADEDELLEFLAGVVSKIKSGIKGLKPKNTAYASMRRVARARKNLSTIKRLKSPFKTARHKWIKNTMHKAIMGGHRPQLESTAGEPYTTKSAMKSTCWKCNKSIPIGAKVRIDPKRPQGKKVAHAGHFSESADDNTIRTERIAELGTLADRVRAVLVESPKPKVRKALLSLLHSLRADRVKFTAMSDKEYKAAKASGGNDDLPVESAVVLEYFEKSQLTDPSELSDALSDLLDEGSKGKKKKAKPKASFTGSSSSSDDTEESLVEIRYPVTESPRFDDLLRKADPKLDVEALELTVNGDFVYTKIGKDLAAQVKPFFTGEGITWQ